jgi:arginyl-tRNA synthetase
VLQTTIRQALDNALNTAVKDGILPELPAGLKLEQPADPENGDWSTNVAMAAARSAKMAPQALAEKLRPYLEAIPAVERVEIKGPGFLNLFMRPDLEAQVFGDFLRWLDDGAKIDPADGKPQRILVEFVSANPTGPLHVGHGRGAAVGDATARVLRRVGHSVETEYYVNDAGRQMDNLGASLEARARELRGEPFTFPEDGYKGDYMVDIARDFLAAHGDAFAGWDDAERTEQCRTFAMQAILDHIRMDLERFRVTFDHWQSERALYASGAVEAAVDELRAAAEIETIDGAEYFRSDRHGDEKPRVVIRSDGIPTYFAADIAYHREKIRDRAKHGRGFDQAIDFWGSDHHGYEPRVRAAMRALGQPDERLVVRFIQFVSLVRGGETVSMSTRAGTFETLEDVVRDVGIDAARFFYLLRTPDRHLEFDLDLARSQANENPVYYVQYAHARSEALRRMADERGIQAAAAPNPADLTDDADRELLRKLLSWPEAVQQAAADLAPHQIVYWVQDLAAVFHGYYNKQRILDAEPATVAGARLRLALAVGQVLRDALGLIGVAAPERM